MVAAGEVFNGDAHHPVEMLVDLLNIGLKFLPENFLLASGRCGSLGDARREE
jgi:hypothetical protein